MKYVFYGATLLAVMACLVGCPHRYVYENTALDGTYCKVTVDSYSNVQAGAIKVTDNCELESGAERIGISPEVAQALGQTLIELGRKVP